MTYGRALCFLLLSPPQNFSICVVISFQKFRKQTCRVDELSYRTWGALLICIDWIPYLKFPLHIVKYLIFISRNASERVVITRVNLPSIAIESIPFYLEAGMISCIFHFSQRLKLSIQIPYVYSVSKSLRHCSHCFNIVKFCSLSYFKNKRMLEQMHYRLQA